MKRTRIPTDCRAAMAESARIWRMPLSSVQRARRRAPEHWQVPSVPRDGVSTKKHMRELLGSSRPKVS